MSTTPKGDSTDVTVRKGIVYTTRDGEPLRADFYSPAGSGPFPVVVAAPGGGWFASDPGGFRYWGQFLARHGFAMFAFQYRVSALEKTFPKPVLDALDAIRYVSTNATELNVDPERLALLGSSAGAHVSALAALGANTPLFSSDGPALGATAIKAFAGIYGVYDMFALWQKEIADAPLAAQRRSECALGVSPYGDRQIYFDASPISHVRHDVNRLPVFLAWGATDTVVAPETQSVPFAKALKQAGFQVQTCPVEGAGHFWFSEEPIDEPGSFTAFLAPRLLRFLQRHVPAR